MAERAWNSRFRSVMEDKGHDEANEGNVQSCDSVLGLDTARGLSAVQSLLLT